MPFCSVGRRVRVVAETASRSRGTRASSAPTIVPFPAPEGPVRTKTGPLPVEEVNQLLALAVGQAAHGLRLADAALVEHPLRLHAAELGDGHQHVEHLRGRDELRGLGQNLLDRDGSGLEVLLQLSPLYPDV